MKGAPKDGVRRYSGAIRTRVLELARSDPDEALRLAAYYGAFLHFNHIGIYADPELERGLTEALESLGIPHDRRHSQHRGVLHLATEVYPWGGHTRVIERLVGCGLGDAVATLSPMPAPVRAALRDRCRVVDSLEGSDRIETVRRIVAAGRGYGAVVLHIHPFDIASAVAAGILARRGVRILLYNHADHGFGFGFAPAEKVLELSKYGWGKAPQRGIEGKQAYVGIPVESPAVPPGAVRKSRHVLSSGWSPKFKPFREINAAAFIEALVDRLDGDVRFDVVGPGGREPPFRDLRRSARRRVTFHGLLPHERFTELLAESGVYVDSFPQGNGTGFVEALLSGAPCFGLDLLAGCSHADVLRSHTLEDLIERVAAFLQRSSDPEGRFDGARALVRAHQSSSACASRLTAVLNEGVCEGLPAQLELAPCMMDFYERYWEAGATIALVPRAAASLSASLRRWLLAQASRELARTELLEWGKLAWICLGAGTRSRK
jgi:glycosyltransferase involved in cell wall biosynthesis